jgi:hypothetical protein
MPALYVASELAFYHHLKSCIAKEGENKIILLQTPNNRFKSSDLASFTFSISSFIQLTAFLNDLPVGSCKFVFVDDISTLLMPLTSLSYNLLLQVFYSFVKVARKIIAQGQISIISRLWQPHQQPRNSFPAFEHFLQLLNATVLLA